MNKEKGYRQDISDIMLDYMNRAIVEDVTVFSSLLEYTEKSAARLLDHAINSELQKKIERDVSFLKKQNKGLGFQRNKLEEYENKFKEETDERLEAKINSLKSRILQTETIIAEKEQAIVEIEKEYSEKKKGLEAYVNDAKDNPHKLAQFWTEYTGFESTKNLKLLDIYNRAGIHGGNYESEGAVLDDLILHNLSYRTDFLAKHRQLSAELEANFEGTWYKAEVVTQEDPLFATAGSTTGNCDAFGHGKRAQYMINPGAAQFVLSSTKGKRPHEWGTHNIISQSLILDEKQFFSSAEERNTFYSMLHEGNGRFDTIIKGKENPEAEVRKLLSRWLNSSSQVTLDNVEVPPNVKKKYSPQGIYNALQRSFNSLSGFRQKDVVIGTNYSYLEGDSFPKVNNRSAWATPIAYSDNDPSRFQAISLQQIDENKKHIQQVKEMGIRPMKPQDSMPVAMMEDIAFRSTGGAELINGFYGLSNEIYSSCIQSAHRGHNPLSFIEEDVDEHGKNMMNGYLIAYEKENGEIYIGDTASIKNKKGTGTRLLMTLLNSVGSDSKLNHKKITMDARGDTSGKILASSATQDLIAGLEFYDEKERRITYSVSGPSLDQIKEEKSLYRFEIIPKIEEIK
jgi:hypothetical protein